MSGQMLPPLPPSDGDSLQRNHSAHSFWKGAEIIRVNDTPIKRCKHNFISVSDGIRCTLCNFGLLGSQLTAKDGIAYAQGKPIKFPE